MRTVLQVASPPLDIEDDFLKGRRSLLADRDLFYTPQFRALLSSAGVTTIRLSPSSLSLTAYAEHFIHSIQSQCLSKLVLLSESHLRAAVRKYLATYRVEQNHHGLSGQRSHCG